MQLLQSVGLNKQVPLNKIQFTLDQMNDSYQLQHHISSKEFMCFGGFFWGGVFSNNIQRFSSN